MPRRIFNNDPGHDNLLRDRSGPFHVGQGNPTVGSFANGVVHDGRTERRNKALSLERLLVRVNGVADVHREDECNINLS